MKNKTPDGELRTKVGADQSERIQKVMARSGIGSRRQAEEWIRQGRVVVNGKGAVPGQRINPSAQVELDGRLLKLSAVLKRRVLLYHKPEGELCTRQDPAGRRTIFDSVGDLDGERLVSVGRLDVNTSGVLLLTTDGELANQLMHPRHQIERHYRCRVQGRISEDDLRRLRRGIKLDDGMARFDRVERDRAVGSRSSDKKSGPKDVLPRSNEMGRRASNQWYRVTLTRGRYREVRRLWEAVGGRVSRLIRTRYGTVTLSRTLAPGQWVELEESIVERLAALVDGK